MQTKKNQKDEIINSIIERIPSKYTDLSFDLNK